MRNWCFKKLEFYCNNDHQCTGHRVIIILWPVQWWLLLQLLALKLMVKAVHKTFLTCYLVDIFIEGFHGFKTIYIILLLLLTILQASSLERSNGGGGWIGSYIMYPSFSACPAGRVPQRACLQASYWLVLLYFFCLR